jgi:nucleoid DNA-binding protein
VNFRELATEAARAAGIPYREMEGYVQSFMRVANYHLASGDVVNLGPMGKLTPRRAHGNSRHWTKGVKYTPTVELRKQLERQVRPVSEDDVVRGARNAFRT